MHRTCSDLISKIEEEEEEEEEEENMIDPNETAWERGRAHQARSHSLDHRAEDCPSE